MKHFSNKLGAVLIAFVLSVPTVWGQARFATTQLQHTAKQLGLLHLDTLKDGNTILRYKGQRLNVRKEDGRVESIGRRIFNSQLRKANPLPIYDYLEFAYLDKLYKVSDNPLLYKDLKFTKGSWETMADITEATPCNITMTEDKRYSVSWTTADGQTIAALTFPMDYEKFAMTSRRELEANFIKDLKSYKRSQPTPALTLNKDGMDSENGQLWTLPGSSYLMNAINNDTYYILNRKKELQTLWLVKNPARSVRNLFCVKDPAFDNISITIRFTMYDMSVQTVKTLLPDFLDFCRHKGCEVYVGIESFDDDEVKASVFMYDRASGYDHIFTVSVPSKQVGASNCEVSARGSLYSPTTNVTTLFYEFDQSKNKKPIKWKDQQ